ncbi:hypothetical protein I6B53_03260 [Schaalia sp. 19OD2882]|uniref:hypothetical protein n=1 Tax=Schaalia sp. 19OD2882 TaxID=2794089 RepID=UPI001C1E9AC4|nr:hypothetical protein [Schaalia sp. 19OD2882]QWW20129.1 hypothetical protein I6B53_03260 [Schaalia sp. 19OD2882]
MATLNALNALMFGSDNDSLYLGEHSPDDVKGITGLKAEIPQTLIDMGWVSEDGLSLDLADSVSEIKGHQGHGTVRTFMSDSTTKISAVFLESKLKTVEWNLDAKVAKLKETVGSEQVDIAKLTVPAARKVRRLSGVIDAFDTSDSSIQWRVLFPTLELGEREGVQLKVGEITAWKYTLQVIGEYYLLTNHKAMIPA